MLAQYAHRLVVVAFAVLASASTVLAGESAQDLKNQALLDIASLRDSSSGSLRNHLNDAIRALNRTADSFVDGNHVSSPEVFDRFDQAAESIRQGAREAVRRSQVATADRLKANADRLARSARLLATILIGDVRGDVRPIDRSSAAKRARRIEKADCEVARGDAALAENDRSFRDYAWPGFEPAIQRFRDAWKEADKAGRHRLRLDSVSDSPDPFNPQRTSNTLAARYEVRLRGDAQTIRTEWTILSATGEVLRRILAETPVPRRQGRDPRVGEVLATLTFDGLDDGGAALADGTYAYRVTGSILPEEDDEDDEDEDQPCERGNCLDGFLSGSVTIDRAAPRWENVAPVAGATTDDLRQGFSADLVDGGGGVDVSTIRLRLDGADVTAQAGISASRVSFTPSSDLACGIHRYEAEASDLAGNSADALVVEFEVICQIVVIVPPDTGGDVTVPDDHPHLAGLTVAIPPGATETPATITISPEFAPPPPLEGGELLGTVARIESSQGGFLAPVSIVFPYDEAALGGASEEDLVLARFDDASGTWVVPEPLIFDAAQNTVTTQTTSLSLWAIYVVLNGVSPTRSTVQVVPASMRVDSPAPQAVVEVIPRKYSGALVGSGRQVTISIVSGAGSLGPVRDLGNGTYRADLTAPTKPGTARFRAMVGAVRLLQEPIATYLVGAATSFLLSGLPSTAEAGEQLPFTLVVRDRFDNVATDYAGRVDFESTDPLATLNGQAASTFRLDFSSGKFQGQANLTLRLGTVGSGSLTARDTVDPTLQASASITVRPGPVSAIVIVEGNGQAGEPGSRLPRPLRARAEDAFGNVVSGVGVAAAITSGDGQLQRDLGSQPEPGPLAIVTDAAGEVSALWTLGPAEGTQTAEMRPAGTTLVATFTATAAVDMVAPTITFDAPANFALLASGAVLIQARYADDLSGIDPQTAQILVNNVDLTAFAQVGQGTIQLDLQGGLELFDGIHSAIVRVQDRAGNEAFAEVQFIVDSAPPDIRIEPPNGTTITSFPVTFEVRIADAGSGLFDNNASIIFNGVDMTNRFAVDVTNRFDIFDVGQVAQVIVLTWTPTVEDFVGLVRASGDGTLILEADEVDRARNRTVARARYPVNLSGDGEDDPQVPRVIELREAGFRTIPPPPNVTKRARIETIEVQAVDLARGETPVEALPIHFGRGVFWGFAFEHVQLSTTTNQQGVAGIRYVNGPTAQAVEFPIVVPSDLRVRPLTLQLAAEAPLLQASSSQLVTVAAGSGVPQAISVRVSIPSGTGVPQTLVRLGRVGADGAVEEPAESQYYLLPRADSTDGGGTARFLLGTSKSMPLGRHTFRAEMVEYPGDAVDFAVDVVAPTSTHSFPAERGLTCDPVEREIHLEILSGNGQIGAADLTLSQELRVQLLENGQPREPIDQSHDCDDQKGNETTVKAQVVTFAVVEGGGVLTLAEGMTEVPLDPPQPNVKRIRLTPQGQAAVLLTYGTLSESHIVSAALEIENEGRQFVFQSATVAFVEGAPEVELVDPADPGMPITSRSAVPYDPLVTAGTPPRQYLIRARMPVTEPQLVQAGCRSTDRATIPVSSIAGAIAPVLRTDLRLVRLAANERYASYETPPAEPLVFITRTLGLGQSPPSLPSGPTYVQTPRAGLATVFAFSDEEEASNAVPVDALAFSRGAEESTLTADGFDPHASGNAKEDDPILMASDISVTRDGTNRVDSQVRIGINGDVTPPVVFASENDAFEIVEQVDEFAAQGLPNASWRVTVRGRSAEADTEDTLIVGDKTGELGRLTVKIWKRLSANAHIVRFTNAAGGSTRTQAQIDEMKERAQLAFRQAGIDLTFSDAALDGPAGAFTPEFIPKAGADVFEPFIAANAPQDAIFVVLCGKYGGGAPGETVHAFTPLAPPLAHNFIVIDDTAGIDGLAHEVGHHIGNMFGLPLSHEAGGSRQLSEIDPDNFMTGGRINARGTLTPVYHMMYKQVERMRAWFVVTPAPLVYAETLRVAWSGDLVNTYKVVSVDPATGRYIIVQESDPTQLKEGIPYTELSRVQ